MEKEQARQHEPASATAAPPQSQLRIPVSGARLPEVELADTDFAVLPVNCRPQSMTPLLARANSLFTFSPFAFMVDPTCCPIPPPLAFPGPTALFPDFVLLFRLSGVILMKDLAS